MSGSSVPRRPQSEAGAKRMLWLLLFAYALYASRFIWMTSFVYAGQRFFVLFDDAMISMCYAKNLALGHGLVWNPGERVEGFTNPLWTFLMAGVHLLPLPASKICLVFQVLGALLVMGAMAFSYRITRRLLPEEPTFALGAAFLCGFYYPLSSWALLGMEVGACALVCLWAVDIAMRAITAQRFSFGLYVLLGVGTLLRLDMALLYLALWAYVWWAVPALRCRNLLAGAAMLVACMGGQTLARYLYYGELLPNTYYLKMTGYPALYRISRGAWVFARLLWGMNWMVAVIVLGGVAFGSRREAGPIGFVVLAQCAYSVYIGGDAWDKWGGANRFVSTVMPLVCVLFVLGVNRLIRLLESLKFAKIQALGGQWRQGVLGGCLLLGCVTANAYRGTDSLADWLLQWRPQWSEGNDYAVRLAYALREVTTPKGRIAVTWAGALPYYVERPCIDLLGKCDRTIARMPARTPQGSRWTSFYPGHMKWDYAHSIAQLCPDAAVFYWPITVDEEKRFLENTYRRTRLARLSVYLREGSREILWPKLLTKKGAAL